MNFELGKEYIVKVSEEGIIPIEEFNDERYLDKDLLMNEEKKTFVARFTYDIVSEIDKKLQFFREDLTCKTAAEIRNQINDIILDYSRSYLGDNQQ